MIFCVSCGNGLPDHARFCGRCGSPVSAAADVPAGGREVDAAPTDADDASSDEPSRSPTVAVAKFAEDRLQGGRALGRTPVINPPPPTAPPARVPRALGPGSGRRGWLHTALVAGGITFVLLLAGTVWLFWARDRPANPAVGSNSASGGPAAAVAPTSATPMTRCLWNPTSFAAPARIDLLLDHRREPNVADVGTPPTSAPSAGTQTMTITTNLGVIAVTIDDAKVPCTAASFTYLASKRFFDNTPCYRLTTTDIFVLQCGDPTGTGSGGPAYQFDDENLPSVTHPPYPRGVLAMANAGPNTNGSQFFIVYGDSDLPPNYAVVGTVVRGLDIVDTVAAGGVVPSTDSPNEGPPKTPVTVTSLTMSPSSR